SEPSHVKRSARAVSSVTTRTFGGGGAGWWHARHARSMAGHARAASGMRMGGFVTGRNANDTGSPLGQPQQPNRGLLSWRDLLWRSPKAPALKSLVPRTPLHWISVGLLWALFLAYAVLWIRGNAEVLFDPLVQADDARTILFPFHRYGSEHALAGDPVAA